MDLVMPFKKLFDVYELKARIFPGLLILLPAIVFMVLVFGSRRPVATALATLFISCGGPYLLASFIRTWGQRAQEKLYQRWDGSPSTILIRHSDNRLPSQTKLQYHALIEKKLGIPMPSQSQEHDDPQSADQAYVAAAHALRPRTNDQKKYPFVFKELVAYGFNRNAYGARWIGVIVALSTIAITILHANRGIEIVINEEFVQLLDMTHWLTLAVAFSFLSLWLLHFTSKTVEQSAFSYSLRLWETLEQLPTKRGINPVRS